MPMSFSSTMILETDGGPMILHGDPGGSSLIAVSAARICVSSSSPERSARSSTRCTARCWRRTGPRPPVVGSRAPCHSTAERLGPPLRPGPHPIQTRSGCRSRRASERVRRPSAEPSARSHARRRSDYSARDRHIGTSTPLYRRQVVASPVQPPCCFHLQRQWKDDSRYACSGATTSRPSSSGCRCQ